MKTILIDVDDVICDNGFLNLLNSYLNTNYTIDQFTSYYIEEDVLETKEEIEKFYDYIKDKNCYVHARIFDDAVDVLKKLNKVYDIYICSSCAINIPGLKEASGMHFAYKYNFLIENFPFLNVDKFIFTGVKNIIKADVQIDDKLSHLENPNVKTKLLMTAYHNKSIDEKDLKQKDVTRVNSWKDIEKILLG